MCNALNRHVRLLLLDLLAKCCLFPGVLINFRKIRHLLGSLLKFLGRFRSNDWNGSFRAKSPCLEDGKLEEKVELKSTNQSQPRYSKKKTTAKLVHPRYPKKFNTSTLSKQLTTKDIPQCLRSKWLKPKPEG
jgi:hypothetical protein